MKPFSLLLACLLCCSVSYAQRPLTQSRVSSFYTYIYPVKDADMRAFYGRKKPVLGEWILGKPIDSARTDKFQMPGLKPGNYLKVFAEENKLKYVLIENRSAFLEILNNKKDFRFILLDRVGNEISNADVYLNGRRLTFDSEKQMYHTGRIAADDVLKVVYQSVSNYYSVTPRESDQPGFWRRLRNSGIIKPILDKFRKLFHPQNDRYAYHPSPYNGYIIFNKPKYKPNDTVKFKALIFNARNATPVKFDRLYMNLIRFYQQRGVKIIGTVNSYRPGGFEGQFVLADSLNLTLDQDYALSLLSEVKPVNDDDSRNSYNQQNKYKLTSGRFRYEEYELKSVKFTARADKKEASPGNPVAMYYKAVDENDLPVADGRIEVTVTTGRINNYHNQNIFIPDTLWHHTMPLEQVGETKLIIPDSIFKGIGLSFRVNSEFLNSNNESQEDSRELTYHSENHQIITKLDNDTLNIRYLVKGKDQPAKAILTGENADDDTLSTQTINLPAKIVINSRVASYDIDADSVSDYIKLKDFTPDISPSASRTADSLFIKVNNPRHIPFWYTVFNGNKIIDGGKAIDLLYQKPWPHAGNVHFRINYLWGGEPRDDEMTVEYLDKLLNISVNQPVSVSPGQQVPIEISVKNQAGKPMADADLSGMAVTSKFKSRIMPGIPYFGKRYPSRKYRQEYEPADGIAAGALKLNWKRWSLEMGLDSIAYFKFTHPKDLYRIEESEPDTITQVAPFVVKDGEILPVHILYIDERPVYFNQAEQLRRYSFAVTPGKHSFKFRTEDQLIGVDTVQVERGRKLILSINDTLTNPMATFRKMPDSLDTYEAELINKYLIGVVNNFGYKMATLKSDNHLLLLNPSPVDNHFHNNILTGPLPSDVLMLQLRGEKPRFFNGEPGYNFEFQPELLKEKSYSVKYPFHTHLKSDNLPRENYKDYVLTGKAADSLWQNYLDNRSHDVSLFRNDYYNIRGRGRLEIGTGYKNTIQLPPVPFIKNIIIYNHDEPDFIQIYPGKATDLGYLAPGQYRIFYLLRDNRYIIDDNVNIKPDGINYRLILKDIKPADSVSIKIAGVIESRSELSYMIAGDPDREKLKETFNEKYLDKSILKGQMEGVVVDETKQPLPGVSVIIKGTNIATATDRNGFFKLKVPLHGKLTVMYIGFESKEVPIVPDAHVTINLIAQSKALNEVVVIGYGAQVKRDLTGSVSTVLQGKAAGIYIRGGSTAKPDSEPLYIVDGLVASKGLEGINPADIADISVLKDAAAKALYGSRGANGVVIITTTKNRKTSGSGDGPGQQQTLRTHFSDYAFWQPRLRTDENGIARFNVTFPDDITNWQTLYIGAAGKYTGYTEGNIKSFKALSANLVSPQFAVKGDKLSVLGKIMNYTTDPVTVSRAFKYNDKEIKQSELNLKTSVIDTFALNAEGTDSLKFEYTIRKQNGYFDGERRIIPVLEQGVLETEGMFKDLEKDTALTLKFNPALGKVTFHAEASVLPVLLDETERLRNYEYLCNEQLASKLKGLLVEKRVREYLHEPFKWDKNIRELIKKLQENRKTQGTWGWWKDTNEELWISLHAAEALLDAEKAGCKILLDKQKLIDYLVYQITSYNGNDKLDALRLLFKLGSKANYPELIRAYEKQLNPRIRITDYEKYKLMMLRQEAGMPVVLDSLLKKKRSTMFGNCYWGEETYNFFANSTQLSLLAYQILKNDGHHPELLRGLRNYFLEQRKDGHWRNTYESSLILETILPDLLVKGDRPPQASLTLKGDRNETITTFPHTIELPANATLNVSKAGAFPVYLTAYQQYWNTAPKKISKDFTVDTWFERNGDKITKLKGGEAVTLQAEVTARADADFVMVEIPIPAGCSYESKEQPYWGNEVHREYFKNKVGIFCRKLKQGKYTFSVKLMPRYGGEYHLNPAKAEMMYFPVFYGREQMKSVVIN